MNITEPHVSLTLGKFTEHGDTSAIYQGERINVFGGIPNEEVTARIIRVGNRRKQQTYGIVTEVKSPSRYRIKPPCPYFGPCTGCQWQHIAYEYQLELKRNYVLKQFSHYPELRNATVNPTVPSPQQFNYRNHARFTVRKNGSVGFINRMSRQFIRVSGCMLMSQWINTTLKLLQNKTEETSQLTIRYGINSTEWLIQPILYNKDVSIPSGQGYYREQLLDKTFRISSPSFFQVNTKQAEKLAQIVQERVDVKNSKLAIDAYAGVGTFAVLLAPLIKKVIAIEESHSALKDAAINTIGINNLEFVNGKTEDVLQTLAETPDVVILDPSRSGCHQQVIDVLIHRKPTRIVYVSCEAKSLAKDLSQLVRGGFQIESVEPIDMFPQTYHVESVTTLTKNT